MTHLHSNLHSTQVCRGKKPERVDVKNHLLGEAELVIFIWTARASWDGPAEKRGTRLWKGFKLQKSPSLRPQAFSIGGISAQGLQWMPMTGPQGTCPALG